MVGGIFRLSEKHRHSKCKPISDHHTRWLLNPEKPDILGILAFDTAKSMSRLVSLYKSLSDDEMLRLRRQVIRARGISFLTSDDPGFLLTLACAERLDDLDRAASVVSGLGPRCSDYGLVRFEQVYKDLKNGHLDIKKLNNYGSKEMQKNIEKMEKFTSFTGELYSELEVLTQLETSERKLNQWKKIYKDHITNYDLFDSKIVNQRKHVRHLKEVSLWNQSYDKIVGVMAKMVCVLYARICALFRPYISLILPNNSPNKIIHQTLFNNPTPSPTMSGPIQNPYPNKPPLVRILSRDNSVLKLRQYNNHLENNNNNNVSQAAAAPSTVGGSGLATRYANVILLSERYFKSETNVGEQARHNLYNLLPSNLKTYLRSKLRVAWRESEDEMSGDDDVAEGWRKAVEDMLTWLVPLAQDTLTWQAERNMEKQRFDSKATVLLLQTLHYADLDKTEAALAEVLVGLSCIFLYQNRRIDCLEIQ